LTKVGQPVTAVTNHNRPISSRLTKSSLKKTFTQIHFREERLSQLKSSLCRGSMAWILIKSPYSFSEK